MARWALICGESGVENAACALRVVERLKAQGMRVGGFVQAKSRNERGEKRYELVRLGDGARALLAVDGVAAKGPTEEFFCSMAFHNEAFDAAGRWVKEDASGSDVLLLDGISKLEVSGKGHCATLENALRLEDSKVILLCARASQLSYVVERFELNEARMVAEIAAPYEAELLEAFVEELRRARDPRGAS